jgi:polar amino acid transport system substrate-binding protein
MSMRWILAVLLAAVGLAGPCRAGEPRVVVVGVETIDYSPVYGYRDGEYVGAARLIFDAFAEARGYRLVYRPLPIKRLMAELVNGGIDLKFPDSPDWNAALREGHSFVYSQPVIAYVDGVVVRRENAQAGPDAIHSIGTVAGFTPFAWLDRIKSGAVQLKENPRFDALLRQVETGRIDGAYANVAVALHAAESTLTPHGAIVFNPNLPHLSDAYRLSAVQHPELIAEFDAWLSGNGALVKDIIQRTGAEKGVR